MKLCKKITIGIAKVAEVVCMIMIAAMVVVIVAELINRNFLGKSFRPTIEICGIAFLWMAFIGLIPLYQNSGLMRLDFLLSKECQQIMSDQFGRRTVRTDVDQPAGLPALEEIGCIDYDFAWAGNKADVVARWDEIAVNVISAG